MENFDRKNLEDRLLPSNLSWFSMTTSEGYDLLNQSMLNNSESDIHGFLWFLELGHLRHSIAWSITLTIAYILVFIVGLIGNLMVITVILLKPPMHPVTNMFLINLAVADLLVTAFCVLPTLIANLFKRKYSVNMVLSIAWILGSFMCKGVAYVQGLSVCASAFSLVALSLDRYKATCHPIERHQGQGITKCQALSSIALIWIFSIIITLPWLFVFTVTTEDGQNYCHEVWENVILGKIYFILAQLLCYFVIPFCLILSSNIAIWLRVSSQPSSESSITQRQMRDSVRKTVGFVTSAFLICWLPLYVLVTIMKFISEERLKEWEENSLSYLYPAAQWLGSLNSSMNPVLYAFINTAFRKGFQRLLSFRFR